MTDERDDPEMVNDPDLELLTDYLAKELDPEQVAVVKRRLDEDEAFRTMAAPLIAVWELPPRWKRNPMPRAELEKHWDEFTKRAGFVHQKRKARRRRLWLLIVLLALTSAAGVWDRYAASSAEDGEYEAVKPFMLRRQYGAEPPWTPLKHGGEIQTGDGSRLQHWTKLSETGMQRFKLLEGSTRFRALPPDSVDDPVPGLQPMSVETRSGATVFSVRAEFTVRVRGDTTDVEVHRPVRPAYVGLMVMATYVNVHDGQSVNPLTVRENERARHVKGQKVVKLPRDSASAAPPTQVGGRP